MKSSTNPFKKNNRAAGWTSLHGSLRWGGDWRIMLSTIKESNGLRDNSVPTKELFLLGDGKSLGSHHRLITPV